MFSATFDSHTWAAVPFHFWSLVFFVFGSIVGSFLNVCIHRMPLGQSIVSPPSHCPHCQYSIPWYLNVPLVTWLYLRGKCRNCGASISTRDRSGPKHRVAPFPLSALPILHPLVSERPAGPLAVSAREVPQLRRAHLHPLFPGRTADGGDVPELLADVREPVCVARTHLRRIPGRSGRRHVHRLRALHYPR